MLDTHIPHGMKHSSNSSFSFASDYFWNIGAMNRSHEASRADRNNAENYCMFEGLAIVIVLNVKGKSSFSRPIVDGINLIMVDGIIDNEKYNGIDGMMIN